MDLETLLKAIVPLAFLAIWALTAVFNKEGNSLPVRTQGPPNPYGPRPGIPPRPAPMAERPPTLRWGPQTPAPATPRAGGDDDIVILDSSRTTKPIPPRANPPRRARAKPSPSVSARPAPIVPARLGLANVTQTVNQQLATPLSMEPLSGPLSATVVRPVVASTTKAVQLGDAPIRAVSVLSGMNDPQRLREAILVNELLQPPLALRGRMRRS